MANLPYVPLFSQKNNNKETFAPGQVSILKISLNTKDRSSHMVACWSEFPLVVNTLIHVDL